MAAHMVAVSNPRRVVRVDDRIIVTFNTETPYPDRTTMDELGSTLNGRYVPQVSSNRKPYLCVLPVRPDYAGAVLGGLRLDERQIPIVKSGGRFRLRSSVCTRWIAIEKVLRDLALALLHNSDTPYVPVDYCFPTSPRQHGFMKSYDTKDAAIAAIQQSRDAFLPLVAHVSWAAIAHRHTYRYKNPSVSNIDVDKGWRELLTKKYNVQEAWMQDLNVSTVFDFSTDRVGVVIDKPSDWAYSNRIPALVEANVPVWLIWRENAHDASSPTTWPQFLIHDMAPNALEVERAVRWVTNSPKGTTDNDGNRNDCEQDIVSKDKKTSETTDIFAWIRDRELFIAKAAELATAEHEREWSERRRSAEQLRMPDKKGSVIYEWTRDQEGLARRRRIAREDIKFIWYKYGARQRWFNYVTNEWELCEDLHPGDTPLTSPDDESEYEDELPVLDDEGSESIPNSESQSVNMDDDKKVHWSTAKDDIDLTHISDAVPCPQDIPHEGGLGPESFSLIKLRFGFRHEPDISFPSAQKKPLNLERILRIIGHCGDDAEKVIPKGLEASVVQFVMLVAELVHPDVKSASGPASLCDIALDSSRVLTTQSTVFVRQESLDQNSFYFIYHKIDERRDWTLAVTDPCTVVHAMRLQPSSLTELVQHLLHSRTPFFTFKDMPIDDEEGYTNTKSEHHVGSRLGLGKRPPGHVFDVSDYVGYETMRDRLLADQRVARAAVKRGGILSRLVSSVVDEYAVFDGPSAFSAKHSTCIIVGGNRRMYDDGITEEEIATLVGLYSIEGT